MTKLSVVRAEDGGFLPEADVGTKTWCKNIRVRAKDLAERVETGYLELGEILYRIYDAPVDGDPNNGSVLARWGYNTIGEFAEKELNLHYKKAQRLVRIFYRIEVELSGLGGDDELKKRFIRLGWSKARELVRVLTLENMESWIERAESMNYTTLVEVIKRTVAAEQNRAIQADIARQPDPIEQSNRVTGDLFSPSAANDPQTSTPSRPVTGEVTEGGRNLGVYAEPPAELSDRKWVSKVFQLESSQAETVNLALKRAQDLAGTSEKSQSSLLALVCLEFLSGADWTGTKLESRLRFLAKIEKEINLKLVVVDNNDEIVYGLGALEKAAVAARSMRDTEEEES